MNKRIKCRYGIEYTTNVNGTKGEIFRFCDLMSKCCCWVCHNHDCNEPRNEIIKDCNVMCDLFTKTPYCEMTK